MTRAERRRQARMQEKCQVPLNLNLTVAQVAGMTGQQASILQTYLKRMEQQTTEAATDAVIREAQEKLERAEDYITITNIIISLYAIKLSWGFTKANKKFLQNWKAAVTNQELLPAMKTVSRYCAEHPHCVRCVMISYCGSTLPREWDFSELEELRNG